MATFTYIRLGYKPFNGDDGGGEEAVAAFNGGTNHYLQEPSPLTIYITKYKGRATRNKRRRGWNLESRNLVNCVGKMYFNVAFMIPCWCYCCCVLCCDVSGIMCTFESAIRSYLYNGSGMKYTWQRRGGTLIAGRFGRKCL